MHDPDTLDDGTAPRLAPWNLAVRFGVELAALIGLGVGGASLGGTAGLVGAVALPLIGIVAWGAFNVEGDPSRSGRAPVPVPGAARLAVEALVVGGGAIGWAVADRPVVAGVLLVAAALVTVTSASRVRWLLAR